MRAKGRGRKNTAYKVVAQGINAADYGAPQKRHRAVIMGISSKLGEDWEFPPPTHSQEALVWSKHIDRDYWERHGMRRIATPSSDLEARISSRLKRLDTKPKGRPWVTVRDAIGDLPLPNKRETISGHWQHPGARSYPHHTGSSLDEPAKALKAGDHGVPGGENMLAFKNGEVRYFTVREMARLQGLPDDFWISGSWKAATRKCGSHDRRRDHGESSAEDHESQKTRASKRSARLDQAPTIFVVKHALPSHNTSNQSFQP